MEKKMIWYKTAQETAQETPEVSEEQKTQEANFDQVVSAAKSLVGNNTELFQFIDEASKELLTKGGQFDEFDILKLAQKKMLQKGLVGTLQQGFNTINEILDSAPMAGIEDLNRRKLKIPNIR
jgi:hypothetical protein